MAPTMNEDRTSVSRLFGSNTKLYDLTQELSKDTQSHALHPRTEVYPFEGSSQMRV